MKVLYTADATATGDGRDGHARTNDGVLDVDLALPGQLGGKGGAKTNPEQLFAAGFAACFHSTIKLVATPLDVDASGSTVRARVGLGMFDGGTYGLEVTMDVHLPNADAAGTERVMRRAHEVCPYSNATRGNVEVTLNVV